MFTLLGSVAANGCVSTTRTLESAGEICSSTRATDAPAALATYSVGRRALRSSTAYTRCQSIACSAAARGGAMEHEAVARHRLHARHRARMRGRVADERGVDAVGDRVAQGQRVRRDEE